MTNLHGLRVMAVHAHPDDEALWTGGMLAHLSRRGADVHVVTCTLGEHGEVIGDPLQGFVAEAADMLGGFRYRELEDSLRLLGVNGPHHRPCLLGGAGRWRDSGMVGTPAADHPRAFIRSGAAAVDALASLMTHYRPDIVVTYGPDGGYGHPDHIRAHEVTHAAIEHLSPMPFSGVLNGGSDLFAAVLARRQQEGRLIGEHGYHMPVVLWSVRGETALKQGIDALSHIPDGWVAPQRMEWTFLHETTADPTCGTSSGEMEPDLAFVPDDVVNLVVRLTDADIKAQVDAMAAHATQLWIADGRQSWTNPQSAWATSDPTMAPKVFALSNRIAQPLLREEHYVVAYGGHGSCCTVSAARESYDSTVIRARGRHHFGRDRLSEKPGHVAGLRSRRWNTEESHGKALG